MDTVKAIYDFLTGLGPSIMMPIIITMLALVLGAKFGRALRAGITVGIGFIGINLIIGLLFQFLGPAAEGMAKNWGVQLTYIDVGWPVAAAIAFGTQIGSVIFVVGLTVNVLMLVFRLTKTLDVDMWNYWHWAFTGSLVYVATDMFWLGILCAAIHAAYTLVVADLTAPVIQKYFKWPDLSISQGWATTSMLIVWPMMKLLDWLGVEKVPAPRPTVVTMVPATAMGPAIGGGRIQVVEDLPAEEPETAAQPVERGEAAAPLEEEEETDLERLRKKIGVFGEPVLLGLGLGLLIGLLAYGPAAGQTATEMLTKILQLAMAMAAVMVLMPRMVSILMEGLIPLSEQAREFLQKRFSDRKFYIGMDSALMIGDPLTLTVGLLLVPITLLLAVLLPGNRLLPFADLAATPFFVVMATPMNGGRFWRTLITGIVIMVIIMYMGSIWSPLITSTAQGIGYTFPEGAAQIGGFANPLGWILVMIAKLLFGK
ncbi:MAG TPA: PTS transporter subunit IIC [Roseiflexaceae bacterium]|nr:PTS transporter subunit IIC [Roseiflexaceae bacterium]